MYLVSDLVDAGGVHLQLAVVTGDLVIFRHFVRPQAQESGQPLLIVTISKPLASFTFEHWSFC